MNTLPHFTLTTWITVVVIAVVTWIIRTLLVNAIARYARQFNTPLTKISLPITIVQSIIIGLGLALILETLGISVTPLLTAIGFGGLAVALGLQSTIAAIVSGLTIAVSKWLQVGDVIELQTGERGTVQDITWRCTTIKTANGSLLVVPNSTLAESMFTNFSQPTAHVSVTIPVLFDMTVDVEHAETVLSETITLITAQHKDLIDADHEARVRFVGLNEHGNGVRANITLPASSYSNFFKLRHEAIKVILQHCQQAQLPLLTGIIPQTNTEK